MSGADPHAAPAPTGQRGWLHRISIRGFRNLVHVDIELPAEGLVLVGDNGEGKTNFLEAIHYLQILRSFRGALDRELVTFGAAGFHVAAELRDAPVSEVAVGFDRAARRKKVTLDGAEPARLSGALGAFPAVIFSPQDAVLVSGAPSVRRRFLDVVLALTSRRYLVALQRYRAALVRRNAALREAGGLASGGGGGDSRERRASLEQRAEVWEPALVESGAVLWRERHEWVEVHGQRYAELCAAIGERGVPRLRYAGCVDDADDAEQALRDAFERKRPLDLRRGLTHVGPHRDDLELSLDDRELRTYGSAGQQRTAAMALRLLEAATLRAHAEREPVVLLDDPFAELDARRATRILELIDTEGRGQTILAVPRASDIPDGLTRLARWRISAGALTREGA
ncbi:MAG TPA: DNA replication and repair protein RecF [Gemmatimonadaceae bacterium]